MMYFNKISELYKAYDVQPPENPLFSLREFDETTPGIKEVKEISYGFYTICFKRLKSGELWYGKTKYDSDSGFMYFLKPGQKLCLHDVKIKDRGFNIYFHEDYLIGHPLFSEIKKYNFFDYEVNEALHLSPREEDTMWLLFNKMQTEYNNNPDEFSKAIILSHLDSVLKYAQRFYKRQFIDRKPLSGATITKFNEKLEEYFKKEETGLKRLPTVQFMSSQLNISSKYLSDLLKQETGKTAIEHIHLYVISEAKNMLVEGEKSVSEIAYHLGFENPPYFSRLFKKEVGVSPKEFKSQIAN